MNKILSIIVLQVLACNAIVAHAQKDFSTKSLKVTVNPIYSINSLGVKYFPNGIDYGSQQPKQVLQNYSYRPAELRANNNLNIGIGLDYEFHLKRKWFVGAGVDFRTAHIKLQYINNPLSIQYGEVPKQYAAYFHEYNDNRNLLGLNIWGGTQFKICKSNDRLYEVKLGLSFVYSTNKTPDYENAGYLEHFQSGGQSYLVPYVWTQFSNFESSKSFENMGYQGFLYIGSEGKKPIFKNSRIYGFYGAQVDYYPIKAPKIATFTTQYAYFVNGADVGWKYQNVEFNRHRIVNVGIKFGLMLK